jgi:hypothetical protein
MKLFITAIFTVVSTGFVHAQNACDSWVKLNDRFSAVTVGDLDVTGNQITVEAQFNMTGPSVNIVSKHWGGFDVNYLLRPVRAEITTDQTGFVVTDAGAFPCDDSMELNKTYHVALVYNGSMLKFYRNGILISEVPVTGNLVTNDWNTAIGEHAPVVTPMVNGTANADYHNQDIGQGFYDESFRGFINEVRIWNVARTQEEIRTYMNAALPDPATQNGLLGYWVFDSLTNKQGNSLYNGTIEGLATIGQTNTTCNGVPDSCDVFMPCKYIAFSSAVPVINAGVTLKWQTEGESEIQNYQVQRSESPLFKQFTIAGTVNAINRTTGTQNYSFTDEPPATLKPEYYYRLQINHSSGRKAYSAIIAAKVLTAAIPASAANLIYPNPSINGMASLRFSSSASDEGYMTIYNVNGTIVFSKAITVAAGSNIIPIDLRKCQKGNYLVRLVLKNNKIVKSIVRL